MTSIGKRLIGFIIVLFSVASLLISLYVASQVWMWRAPLADAISMNLDQLSATLDTTRGTLNIVSGALQDASDSLDTVQASLLTASAALSRTTATLDAANGMLAQDFPASLTTAQTALRSAQTSARLVDDVLASVSQLPFVNVNYKPAVSLNAALGQVADTIAPLVVSMSNIQREFGQTSVALSPLAGNLSATAQSMTRIKQDIVSTRTIVGQYRDQVVRYQQTVVALKESLPVALTTIALALTFVLIWQMIAQWQLLLKGLAWLGGRR
ncbi:MAG: hypothetical protein ABI874_00965, partial [Chloroflexota bacterium]